MNTSLFVPGQRWVSNTEAELGLGIVAEADARRVTLSFPAAAEQRVYAIDNAPLSRIEYPVGEQLQNIDGVRFEVLERHEKGGCFIYLGVTIEGEELVLHEMELDSFVHFNKPLDRLLAGQVDRAARFQLRQDTLEYLHRHHDSEVYGLLGPRVQLLPHQFYIAHQVARRHAPRVLLADEVGLGKTIEAGLIIHQQLFSGRAQRVLILVPDSLVHQWLVEMLRRFNLWFSVFDAERCESLAAESINPFETEQRVLCPLSLLTDESQWLEQAISAGWDLLCVDEAHHLRWSEQEASAEYQTVEALAQLTPGLLLLTATPEQLGLASHFARLRLLDPDRYPDLQQFLDQQQHFQPLNDLVQQLLAAEDPLPLLIDPAHAERLATYLGEESFTEWQQRFQQQDDLAERQLLLASLIDELIDRHGTGRVLFRNTRQTVSGFPGRELEAHLLPLPETLAEQLTEVEFEQALYPETLLGEDWLKTDSRVEWLITWLREHRKDKVLVICSKASTAQQLEQHLRLREGMRTAVFHEGLSILERDRAAAYFADLEEGAQLLICSEIGSEGRNFQFAHQLVMFDLPANPDLLEQRIGRLDRIGQLRQVSIQVPYYENSPQHWLFRWLHEGINAFLSTAAVGEALYESFYPLVSQLQADSAEAELEPLLKATAAQCQQLTEAMQQGQDKLLELNSCRPQQAEQLIEAVDDISTPAALAQYMEKVFDEFGVDQQHQSAQIVVVRPSEQMLIDCFPGLTEDGLSLTYSRNQALMREDIDFLTWEHPMVSGVMELIAGGELGNTAICTLKLPPIKPGTLMLEARYVPFCAAPRALQLSRYLPDASLRLLLDTEGRDLSAVLSVEHMQKLAGTINKTQIPQIIRHARDDIKALAEQAEARVQQQLPGLIEASQAKMQQQMEVEYQRLLQLSRINPAIRQEELDHLQQQRQALQQYLQQMQLQLDAVRVIIAT